MTIKPAVRTADGLSIRYAEAGPKHGDTVVFTNPWPESLYAFRLIWDRIAEHDPDRRASQWQPPFRRIKTIAPNYHAGKDRNCCHVRESGCAWSKRRAFEKGACAVANPALGKDAHDAPVF